MAKNDTMPRLSTPWNRREGVFCLFRSRIYRKEMVCMGLWGLFLHLIIFFTTVYYRQGAIIRSDVYHGLWRGVPLFHNDHSKALRPHKTFSVLLILVLSLTLYYIFWRSGDSFFFTDRYPSSGSYYTIDGSYIILFKPSTFHVTLATS